MTKIFINYRRADSGDAVKHQIREPILRAFGAKNVFIDIAANLPKGRDYRPELEAAVDVSDIFLSIIGQRWLNELNSRQVEHESGERPDFVRIEISRALARDIPVVPVLVGGASVPDARDLPLDIRELSFRQEAQFEPGLKSAEHNFIQVIKGIDRAKQRPGRKIITMLSGCYRTLNGNISTEFRPGDIIQERLRIGRNGPVLTVVPMGKYMMGWDGGRDWAYQGAMPQHEVNVSSALAFGRTPITFAEFDLFCQATGFKMPADENWGRGQQPVVNVSWNDARAYCAWLSSESGGTYRLPSESEWEYACRGGSSGLYAFKESEMVEGVHPWFAANSSRRAQPVGKLPRNAFGLQDMHGNVWEWCLDCWNSSYGGAPVDGTAWMSGDCSLAVIRGGAWDSAPGEMASAYRQKEQRNKRRSNVGFRVLKELRPAGARRRVVRSWL